MPARFFSPIQFFSYAIRNHAHRRPGTSADSAAKTKANAAHRGHCHPGHVPDSFTFENCQAMRPTTDRSMINFYSEETRPGVYRYMAMCPERLAVILDPKKLRDVSDKQAAAKLIQAACAYHAPRWNEERKEKLNNIVKKLRNVA